MRKVTEIPPTQGHRPIELRHLRVAAYCAPAQDKLERFLIQEHHPAIVSRELFETVNQARKIEL